MLRQRTLILLLTLSGSALTACRSQEPAAAPAAAPEPAASGPEAKATGPSGAALPAGHPPAGSATGPHAAAPSAKPEAGGLTWSSEAPLVREQPASAMRAAQYRVAGEAGQQDAELTVFFFGPGQGGSVDDNLQRWIGQFQRPDGNPIENEAQVERRSLPSGLAVTTLDVRGRYTGMAMPGRPAAAPQPDYRALGAIAVGPQGPVFFKLVGPESTVERAAAAFAALVESIQPAR